MIRLLPSLAILAMLVQAPAPWSYPATRTGDATDTYFGKTYTDPYRWLENLKDKDVETWFKAQADLTDGLLAKTVRGQAAGVRYGRHQLPRLSHRPVHRLQHVVDSTDDAV